ncbi:MAG TPA: FadD3 family acyl-CoA ligase [Nocardioides sp.]|nr:FadD3 family acyl-CoA ligase [Nocardioides sp.]
MTTAQLASLAELIDHAGEAFGDRDAVVDGDLRLTYRELVDASRDFAAALVASGVGPGDRVAIWAPNSREWIVAVLGIFQAGATLVPVNTRYKGTEAADMLRRAGVKVLVTATEFLGTDYVAMLRDAAPDLPALEHVVLTRGPVVADTTVWDDFVARATDEDREEVRRRSAALGPEDPSDILFTSGTTGVPKGVVMTHGRTLRVATDWVAMTGLQPGDVYLMVNPYFHMFGLKAGILASVAGGATMLPEPVFDIDRALRRVQEEKVTVFPGAPTIYQTILDHPDRDSYDLSSLRIAVTGAADIPVELIRRIDQELPFTTIISGYGLSEAGTATGTGPGDDVAAVATTVGRIRPGFELRIADQEGNAVPDGETGEVLLRGGSVMSHYLDDPEATAEAFTSEGYLKTGDLGTLDEAGRLRIVGRVKDMFIVGGFNAYPAEIENALRAHPAVRDVAVIGIPDERLGEVGMAFVVPASGATATPEEIVAWSRDQMANFKVPRRVEFIDALPLNATGKVEKNRLREMANGR